MDFSRIDALLSGYREVSSVLLMEMDTGKTLYSWNISRRVRSASIIKLFILGCLCESFEMGTHAPSDILTVEDSEKVAYSLVTDLSQKNWRIDDIATLMIILSDNTATNVLIDLLRVDTVNAFLENLGINSTRLQRKMMDFESAKKGIDNYTTLEDAGALLSKVYYGNLVTKEHSQWFMDVLSKQKDKKMLGRFLPEDVKISNKTGLNAGAQHDIGFIEVNGNTYMVGVFLDGIPDEVEGFELIGKISHDFYKEVSNA